VTKPIALSFFAGAGGLDMGIHAAGFDIKLAVELEPKYCNTLELNHPEWHVKQGDIMDYSKDKAFNDALLDIDTEIDLIIGGSPCQSFSTAGKRQAFEDPRGQAMLKYADLVEEIRPKAFVLENVKGLLSAAMKHRPLEMRGDGFPELTEEETRGSALKHILGRFKHYSVEYKTLNSANYGVAQKRERVFVIGIRKDIKKKFVFPEPTHTKEEWITVDDVLSNLEKQNLKHEHTNYSEARLKYMKMIPAGGGNWRDLPEEHAEEAMGGAWTSGGGKVGFFRRVKAYEPSPTLLTSPIQKSTNIGHPYEDRPLSIQEYLAIQGFPLNYKISGSLSDKYKQIGNAVPVKLAEVIGNSIFNHLY